jgi:DNA-binding CsgD family transcriptional regulator
MGDLERELGRLGGPDITSPLEELSVRAFIVDRDARVRWQNSASLADGGNWTGRTWTDVPLELRRLFAGADLSVTRWVEQVAELLDRVVSSREPADFGFDGLAADGSVTRREISAAPLQRRGTVVGILGIDTVGQAPEPSATASAYTLTKRQLEILELLAAGRSTTQIAVDLHLAQTTVRNHIAGLMATLGVHSRVQAVVAANRAGLIQLP